MKSVLQQLQEIEQSLKDWISTDNAEAFLRAVHEDAANIPEYARGATPEACAAGKLISIKAGADILLKRLKVEFTTNAQITVTGGDIERVPDSD